MSMVTDARGRLWIGTASGLVMCDGERLVRIAPDRLSATVFKLSKDPDGTLWVGSSKGLYRVTPARVLKPAPWDGSADIRAGTVVHDMVAATGWERPMGVFGWHLAKSSCASWRAIAAVAFSPPIAVCSTSCRTARVGYGLG